VSIFRDFRRIADALERLATSHSAALQAVKDHGPATDRLDALELDRHRFEAEMEGLLLKSEGKLKAANNSEARERHQREKHERDFDPFPEDREEGPERLSELYADGSEEEELQPVHLGMEKNSKAYALRAKFS